MKKLALRSLLLCSALAATSANAAAELDGKFSVHLGLTYGGDDISTLEYENGNKTDITAGGLALFGAGYALNFNEQFGVKLNGSYHFDMASASNGDASFDRFEFEAIPFYQVNENFRLGIGAALHTGVEYESDFDTDITFESATAFIISGDYRMPNDSGRLELRYVSVDYTADKVGNVSLDGFDVPSIDGSHLGLVYHWEF